MSLLYKQGGKVMVSGKKIGCLVEYGSSAFCILPLTLQILFLS